MFRRFLSRLFVFLATWAMVLPLAACGNSGGDLGEVVIGLTDADGDFLVYEVAVTSIVLTRDDGLTVETVPATTRVDFAKYTELTELFTVATVPPGTYTRVSLGLDYADADVRVDVGGTPVPAQIFNEDGVPLRARTVVMELDNRHFLNVKKKVPSHLILDFDLAATHEVDLTDPAAPVVTARPLLLARVNPDITHRHRLRGLLEKVNPDAGLFQVRVRPFTRWHGHFGVFPVKTDETTWFDVDGVTYQGAAGMRALAALPAHAPVVVLGGFNRAHRHLRGTHVRAGTSVPWAGRDAISGTVVAREGNLLTLLGGEIVFGDGQHGRVPTAYVDVGPDTRVTREYDPGRTLDHLDISVGARITAIGQFLPSPLLSADGTTATEGTAGATYIGAPPTLDATVGYVRQHLSELVGEVLEIVPGGTGGTGGTGGPGGPGSLTVALHTIDSHPQEVLELVGTGSSSENDADPAAYQIATGALPLDSVVMGEPIQVRGYPTRFGTAPPDFEARSINPPRLDDRNWRLGVVWDPPTDGPFTELTVDGATFNLAGAARAVVKSPWHLVDLTLHPQPVRLLPEVGDEVLVGFFDGDTVILVTGFAAFAETLEQMLSEGATVEAVHSLGTWDGDTGTFFGQTTGVRVHRPVS